MSESDLRLSTYQTLLSLATQDGINASGKDDVYGCIFGRDSAITILKILKACTSKKITTAEKNELYAICKRALLKLLELQGKETNIESGEEPGKFIHEYRPDKYERLLTLEKPWYIYPDGVLRNYDSLDSTPLILIAIYTYWKATNDNEFLLTALSHVEKGLNWIITYGDKDKDYLVEYELHKDRKHGGLVVQSWTDSVESLLQKGNAFPVYPIAPVEVQGYSWLALKLWADFYATNTIAGRTKRFSQKLQSFARHMKERFNEAFVFEDSEGIFLAQALDGNKQKITTITGNPLLLLWAAYKNDGRSEAIIAEEHLPSLVKRVFCPDMFNPDAGIRTMSSKSETYVSGQNSYHNGSFWPKLNGMSHEGLMNFGFVDEAQVLKHATLKPVMHFQSPIELYVTTEDGSFLPYTNPQGQQSCREQAWSAAVIFELLNS